MRLRFFQISLPVACALIGAACSSLPDGKPNLGPLNTPSISGDPCRNADWFEVGRVDGLNGIPAASSAYVGRCAAQGVAINEELYQAGWQRGLVDYCTPERAYDAGRSGESYNGVCPKNLEPEFQKRFRVGHQIATLEKKNVLLETEVDRKLNELARLESETTTPATILNDAISRMPGSSTPPANESRKTRQTALQNELQILRDQLARNEHAIRELEKSAASL